MDRCAQVDALSEGAQAAVVRLAGLVPAVLAQDLPSDVLVRLGESLHGFRLSGEARLCFEQALAACPSNGVALNDLGVLAMEAGDTDLAERLFARAHELDPSCDEALRNLMAARSQRSQRVRSAPEQRVTVTTAVTAGADSGSELFPRIPGALAFSTLHGNPNNRWPARSADNRLEPLCAPVLRPSFGLEPGETIFTMGSCFARNIEFHLHRNGYRVPALDFTLPEDELFAGTKMSSGALNKYTPHSILNEIAFAFEDHDPDRFFVDSEDGGYLDLQLHINRPVSLERARARREQVGCLYRSSIREARVIVITLGLIEVWWDEHAQVYLNETPNRKLVERHPGRFFFEILSPESVFDSIFSALSKLKAYGREDLRVLLTVSPVPLTRTFSDRDVIVANSYSKSVLRAGAEIATRRCGWVDYFPSYESVMLSDRHAAWEDDQLHVTTKIVEFNVRRMLDAYAAQGPVA